MWCDRHQEEMVLWGKREKCRSCNREYNRSWWQKHKPTQRARVKSNTSRYITRNARYIREYLTTHPCVDCGESDIRALEFDHINRETKLGAISSLRKASLERLVDEIAKCEVRCSNCHRKRTSEQLGWHKYLEEAE